MEEKTVVYVAGNPDAYPLEYYDKDSGTYQGVIPQLLARFSAQSGYELLYYPTDGVDKREHLAKNVQVDIVSGYQAGEPHPDCEGWVTLLQTQENGQQQTYVLGLTAASPPALKGELEAFLQGVPQEEVVGLLIDTRTQPQDNTGLHLAIGALSLALAMLGIAMLLLVRRYRKRLNQAVDSIETDEGTGLGNFDYLLRYYKQIVNDKNRVLYHLIYFYVDTDRLRRIGGSQETTDFLRYCAVVLQEYTGDTDLLAKVSDQGFVLLRLSGNLQTLRGEVGTLLSRIRTYSQIYGKTFEVGMWAGIYSLRAEDRDLNEIIFRASQGAHEAWHGQEDCVIYTGEMQQKIAQERSLQSSVDRALANHEFQLYLQFYVEAKTFRIIGAEALSRWEHPVKGLLTPKEFIPLLEREGGICKLDYYCLRESCRFLEELRKQGIEQFFLSCNFSRDTFGTEDFVVRCKEIMEDYHFPRELMIFELTESSSQQHIAQIKQNMIELKKYGVSIALDDFGEGFTSFCDLQEYPVDGIKLDKGLVANSTTKPGIAILRAIVQAGHELGITILAEGVENAEEIQAMQEIHCDVIQGFRFYRPIPAQDAKDIIQERFSGRDFTENTPQQ